MAIKTFTTGEVLTAADTNTYLANSGLVYITNGSKSGSGSYTFDSVFTATYTNYRVVVDQITVTNANAVRFQFRAGGATNATATYNYAYRGLLSNGTTNDTSGSNFTYAEPGVYINFTNVELGTLSTDIFDAQLAKRTRALVSAQGYEGAAAYRNGGFEFYGTNQFDGFLLSVPSGTFSFVYTIYGYRTA